MVAQTFKKTNKQNPQPTKGNVMGCTRPFEAPTGSPAVLPTPPQEKVVKSLVLQVCLEKLQRSSQSEPSRLKQATGLEQGSCWLGPEG